MSVIERVGVVGCGLMGSGIAQVCAEAGFDVVVREVSDELLKKGLGKIDSFLAKGVERGKVTAERKAEVMGRLKGTTKLGWYSRVSGLVRRMVRSRRASASTATCSSSRESGAPMQKWMPLPNARWSLRLGRSGSKRSGSSPHTAGSRLAAE